MAGVTGGEARRTATVTVLFCDLVGSTERLTRLGDEAADEFRIGFFEVLAVAVATTHGETVKNTGDGLMVVYTASAVDAVTCASKMHDAVEKLDPDDPAFVRVGISAGEAASEHGDWFGTPVVEAARLCAAAQTGQTLVSELVRGLVGSRGGHQFRSVGALALKGLAEPLPTAAVIRTPITASAPIVAKTRSKHWPVVLGAALAGLAVVLLVGLAIRSSSHSATTGVPAAKGYTPRYVGKRCAGEFLKQVPNGTCGELAVPEDRSKPRGRWLHLVVVRAPARSGAGAADPVIDIQIGALVSTGFQEDFAKSPARDHSELITIATRLSEAPDPAMACPEFEPAGRELMASSQWDLAVISRAQVALRACHDRLVKQGVALSSYTLDDAAGDVLDLVRALHLQRINLVVGGDNAISAYAIVRAAPDAVRSLTLESPVAPGMSPLTDPTSQLADAFDEYVALCSADAACARAYPDLKSGQRAAWQAANESPTTVEVPIPSLPPVRLYFDGARTAKAIASAVGSTESRLLAAGIAGSSAVVPIAAQLAGLWDYSLVVPNYPWARSLGSWCSYDISTISGGASISSDARPALAGVDDGSRQWECAAWRVHKISDSAFASVASNVPTLIVEGLLNPMGSHQWTLTLQGGLTHVATLTFPSLGTLLLKNGIPPCLNDLRRAFLADPTKRLDTKACTADSPRINFAYSSP